MKPSCPLVYSRARDQSEKRSNLVSAIVCLISPRLGFGVLTGCITPVERSLQAKPRNQALPLRYTLRILSSAEPLDYFSSQIRLAFAPVDALAALVLLVILVGIADT